MPPVRTAKVNSAADAPAPGLETPKKRLLKPVSKGIKAATFDYSNREWDGLYHRSIGTATRTIHFGHHFVLTDEHIEDIAVLARPVREKITQLSFRYSDVSYDAKNDARAVTNQGALRLTKILPNLKVLKLQGTAEITDEGIAAFLKNLSSLQMLEVTGTIGMSNKPSGRVFDEFRQHPEWAPDLRSLAVKDNESDKVFMKSMREMSKLRPSLIVSLVSRSQEKKWGDWELTSTTKDFGNGRKMSTR
ncbi:hypothetical protein FIE12Z_9449 [Fusarium flagelliforme]|uniref:Uncharacterized protein n=1 Tax=Fusarium flagelliforme TaxID=2675880 RepID=A0A395MEN4_9HYPO|nr:hypothetical protein FIE12Z_9449 [Fusarium flagelliforme]